ncbi:hypothetical protein LCGC14_1339200 [marine sediment metagenome]|uniref:Uncharacterized protein n=1 Tax=marine sediment metagenome TaxID=412755 RepID=A0A0F9NGE7_9ZZZZ|nr:hypothetical protein [bacterium]
MPSDCQCSTSSVETITVEKVLNNKQATRKLRRLEREVEALENENTGLKRRLRKASINKEKILKDLRSKLDKI